MPDTFTPSDQFTSILPYEIVGYIFRLCLPPIKKGGLESNHSPSPTVPLRFSHVSRTWRAIVHDTPALWTNVCIHNRSAHPDPEILAHILRHSNNWSLSVCIVIIGESSVESAEWIGARMKELFCHAHRIRSFRLDVRSQVGLWGENVPMPPFPRLEDLTILGSISERDNERLYPLFDSPQLRNVTWLSRVRFPEPLLRVGAQIKQLILPVCAVEYMRVAELLQACPNGALSSRLKSPHLSSGIAFSSFQ
ncbi:hypothetical protein BJ138DRAFT_1131381 [Hygrophoropsis aurantiaca]|uniref:Uncharacterized protein n=1 Tax=Hygrophoropsis aurantiaca TaxID=72124 RepID=A0ACB7ZRU7_9AGAM|nr:hypothetical protein BJ138DRAFT_1131381 [Hygrophoropsis aurantiaca]